MEQQELQEEKQILSFEELLENIKLRKRQLDKSNKLLKDIKNRYEEVLEYYTMCRKELKNRYSISSKNIDVENNEEFNNFSTEQLEKEYNSVSLELLDAEIELENSIKCNERAKANFDLIIKELAAFSVNQEDTTI